MASFCECPGCGTNYLSASSVLENEHDTPAVWTDETLDAFIGANKDEVVPVKRYDDSGGTLGVVLCNEGGDSMFDRPVSIKSVQDKDVTLDIDFDQDYKKHGRNALKMNAKKDELAVYDLRPFMNNFFSHITWNHTDFFEGKQVLLFLEEEDNYKVVEAEATVISYNEVTFTYKENRVLGPSITFKTISNTNAQLVLTYGDNKKACIMTSEFGRMQMEAIKTMDKNAWNADALTNMRFRLVNRITQESARLVSYNKETHRALIRDDNSFQCFEISYKDLTNLFEIISSDRIVYKGSFVSKEDEGTVKAGIIIDEERFPVENDVYTYKTDDGQIYPIVSVLGERKTYSDPNKPFVYSKEQTYLGPKDIVDLSSRYSDRLANVDDSKSKYYDDWTNLRVVVDKGNGETTQFKLSTTNELKAIDLLTLKTSFLTNVYYPKKFTIKWLDDGSTTTEKAEPILATFMNAISKDGNITISPTTSTKLGSGRLSDNLQKVDNWFETKRYMLSKRVKPLKLAPKAITAIFSTLQEQYYVNVCNTKIFIWMFQKFKKMFFEPLTEFDPPKKFVEHLPDGFVNTVSFKHGNTTWKILKSDKPKLKNSLMRLTIKDAGNADAEPISIDNFILAPEFEKLDLNFFTKRKELFLRDMEKGTRKEDNKLFLTEEYDKLINTNKLTGATFVFTFALDTLFERQNSWPKTKIATPWNYQANLDKGVLSAKTYVWDVEVRFCNNRTNDKAANYKDEISAANRFKIKELINSGVMTKGTSYLSYAARAGMVLLSGYTAFGSEINWNASNQTNSTLRSVPSGIDTSQFKESIYDGSSPYGPNPPGWAAQNLNVWPWKGPTSSEKVFPDIDPLFKASNLSAADYSHPDDTSRVGPIPTPFTDQQLNIVDHMIHDTYIPAETVLAAVASMSLHNIGVVYNLLVPGVLPDSSSFDLPWKPNTNARYLEPSQLDLYEKLNQQKKANFPAELYVPDPDEIDAGNADEGDKVVLKSAHDVVRDFQNDAKLRQQQFEFDPTSTVNESNIKNGAKLAKLRQQFDPISIVNGSNIKENRPQTFEKLYDENLDKVQLFALTKHELNRPQTFQEHFKTDVFKSFVKGYYEAAAENAYKNPTGEFLDAPTDFSRRYEAPENPLSTIGNGIVSAAQSLANLRETAVNGVGFATAATLGADMSAVPFGSAAEVITDAGKSLVRSLGVDTAGVAKVGSQFASGVSQWYNYVCDETNDLISAAAHAQDVIQLGVVADGIGVMYANAAVKAAQEAARQEAPRTGPPWRPDFVNLNNSDTQKVEEVFEESTSQDDGTTSKAFEIGESPQIDSAADITPEATILPFSVWSVSTKAGALARQAADKFASQAVSAAGAGLETAQNGLNVGLNGLLKAQTIASNGVTTAANALSTAKEVAADKFEQGAQYIIKTTKESTAANNLAANNNLKALKRKIVNTWTDPTTGESWSNHPEDVEAYLDEYYGLNSTYWKANRWKWRDTPHTIINNARVPLPSLNETPGTGLFSPEEIKENDELMVRKSMIVENWYVKGTGDRWGKWYRHKAKIYVDRHYGLNSEYWKKHKSDWRLHMQYDIQGGQVEALPE